MLKVKKSVILKFDLTQQYLSSSIMVCGGYTEVLVDYVEASPDNISVCQAIQLQQKKGHLANLITWLEETKDSTFNSQL